jgi:CRP-like cAMP-binding protein
VKDEAGPRDAGAPANDRAVGWTGAYRCLLDLDWDLAEAVAPSARRVARAAATAMILEGDPGPLEMAKWLGQAADGPGALVIDGVLALSVRVGDRACAELLGAGDVIQPGHGDGEQLLTYAESWRALTPARVALLDARFAQRVRFWPEIAQALLRRAGRRVHNLDIQRAIAAQPRLEVRLALLLWHLAGRWGKVEPGGVRLPVPLTHQLLGQLVAAERPSVTHALARLAHAGLITGQGDEWHLHGDLHEPLASPTPVPSGRAEYIVATVERSRRGRAATAA